jgi:hypothetical protein
MTGADFLYWLEDIWLDLTNLGAADLPSLFFRLALLVIGGTLLLRVVVSVTRSVVVEFFAPAISAILHGIWRTVTFPVWFPYRIIKTGIIRPLRTRRNRIREAEAERRRREQEERDRAGAERREREHLADLERLLKPD